MTAQLEAPQLIEHVHRSLTYTVYETMWVPRSARIVSLGTTARGSGMLQVLQLSKGRLEVVAETEKTDPFKSGSFAASPLHERHLATGQFKGQVAIWDLERLSTPVFSAKASDEMINYIDGVGGSVGAGAPELVTASRDGAVKVWDPRTKDPVAVFEPASKDTARDCWTVAFGHAHNTEDRCVAAGYESGDVKLFDLRTNTVRWETQLSNGVVCTEFDRKDIEMNKLAVSTLENKFSVFDMRTQHPTLGFASVETNTEQSTVWTTRHLPQNRDIWATTGGDGSIKLWKYKYPFERRINDHEGVKKGVAGEVIGIANHKFSTQPISSFSWSPDKEGLCVFGSFDQSIRVAIVTKLNLHKK